MNETPTYWSILPANVRYDKRLTDSEKILYSEITCLTEKTGRCFASNKYFAELYQVSKETISRRVSKLKKLGYLQTMVMYKPNSKEIDKRYIQINQYPIDRIVNTPIDANVKDNNTSINNTSIIKEVPFLIKHINEKYKRSFKTLDERKLKARLKNYSKEEILKAVDNCYKSGFAKSQGFGFCTPEYFTRNDSNIEKWLHFQQTQKKQEEQQVIFKMKK